MDGWEHEEVDADPCCDPSQKLLHVQNDGAKVVNVTPLLNSEFDLTCIPPFLATA